MPAHKHAALMAEYAKDAAETDKPWELWERRDTLSRDDAGQWHGCRFGDHMFMDTWEYRRRPQPLELWVNITLAGYSYACKTKKSAEFNSLTGSYQRIAVHMKEVI